MPPVQIDAAKPVVDQMPGQPAWPRLAHFLRAHPGRGGYALFVLINGFLTIGLLALVAMLSKSPFVFPSLGPTAILLYSNPTHPSSSPRSTLFGHAIGILCGYASLWLLGLTHHHSSLEEGVPVQRVLSAAMALASTGAIMVYFNVLHPPAGATTLIIALGIIRLPAHLLLVEAAVAVLVLQAIIINRLTGFDRAGNPACPDPHGGTLAAAGQRTNLEA